MPSTYLIEPPVECPEDELPLARRVIAACRFRTATQGNLGGAPVSQSPHSYFRRDWLAAELQPDFDRFLAAIDRCGYRGRFLSTVYVYIDVGEHRYWASPTWHPPGSVMLNRASNRLAPAQPIESSRVDLPRPTQLQMEV